MYTDIYEYMNVYIYRNSNLRCHSFDKYEHIYIWITFYNLSNFHETWYSNYKILTYVNQILVIVFVG